MIKNWKTTLASVAGLLLAVAHIVFPKVVTSEVVAVGETVITSAGLAAAKDHNITGGTEVNQPNDADVVKEATKTDQ